MDDNTGMERQLCMEDSAGMERPYWNGKTFLEWKDYFGIKQL